MKPMAFGIAEIVRTGDVDLAAAIMRRNAPLPSAISPTERARIRTCIRSRRANAKASGKIKLPSWFWTASDDKKLIDFIRLNPRSCPQYWAHAAKTVGRESSQWPAVRKHWKQLRDTLTASGVPYPQISKASPSRKYDQATVKAILARAAVAHRAVVAREFGMTKNALAKFVGRYGGKSIKPVRRTFSPEELADIKLGEDMWAKYYQATEQQ